MWKNHCLGNFFNLSLFLIGPRYVPSECALTLLSSINEVSCHYFVERTTSDSLPRAPLPPSPLPMLDQVDMESKRKPLHCQISAVAILFPPSNLLQYG